MANRPDVHAHFRLNLEQQRKRAKDLLKAARTGDADAMARFAHHPPQLAEAQYLVARDLRFDNWAAMKHHIDAMNRERDVIAQLPPEGAAAPDADARTLHIRCGSDIRELLREAGFRGDFLEHSYPYLIGPVREGEGDLAQRARFLVDSWTADIGPPLTFEALLDSLRRDEQQLLASAAYDRVVIWSEADCYDQLVSLRLLAHYATQARPAVLEMVNVATYPGTIRFIGLGQLPPEALRLLWARREAVSTAQLSLGLAGWKALASPDPRPLAELARRDTPALPLLAPALQRHLAELPSLANGLGFTQQMALALLQEAPQSLNRLFARMTWGVDPLPGQGDAQVRDRLAPLSTVRDPLVVSTPGLDGERRSRPPWTDVLHLTDAGRRVLACELDYMSLEPPRRWVGGVELGGDRPDWRWDPGRRMAAQRVYRQGSPRVK